MTYQIKVLGSGCTKCKNLTHLTSEVIDENKIDATIEKVEDIMKIMEYNIMTTPALVVNEKIVCKGRVPSKQEILEMIQAVNQ